MNCVSNIASRLTFNVILIAPSLSYLVGNFSIKDYLCWCVCQAVLFNLDCIIEIDLDSIGRQYQEKFSADAPSTLQRRWCNAHGSWLMAHDCVDGPSINYQTSLKTQPISIMPRYLSTNRTSGHLHISTAWHHVDNSSLEGAVNVWKAGIDMNSGGNFGG